MPPGEIGLLIGLVILATGALGYGIDKWDKKRRRIRRQGEANIDDVKLETELRCIHCNKIVNPENGDVYDRLQRTSVWWCRKCWIDLH